MSECVGPYAQERNGCLCQEMMLVCMGFACVGKTDMTFLFLQSNGAA